MPTELIFGDPLLAGAPSTCLSVISLSSLSMISSDLRLWAEEKAVIWWKTEAPAAGHRCNPNSDREEIVELDGPALIACVDARHQRFKELADKANFTGTEKVCFTVLAIYARLSA